MDEQREEELELELEEEEELELLWVEVRRVGKEKGIFFFVVPFGLGFYGGRSWWWWWWWWWGDLRCSWSSVKVVVVGGVGI